MGPVVESCGNNFVYIYSQVFRSLMLQQYKRIFEASYLAKYKKYTCIEMIPLLKKKERKNGCPRVVKRALPLLPDKWVGCEGMQVQYFWCERGKANGRNQREIKNGSKLTLSSLRAAQRPRNQELCDKNG